MGYKFNPTNGLLDLSLSSSALAGYVPYTGATQDVILGSESVSTTGRYYTTAISPVPNGFSAYKTISIPAPAVQLTNFRQKIVITNDANIGARCLASGYDIKFFADSGMSVELPTYNETFSKVGSNASGVWYVSVTRPTGTATTIYCAYGKASATNTWVTFASLLDSSVNRFYRMQGVTDLVDQKNGNNLTNSNGTTYTGTPLTGLTKAIVLSGNQYLSASDTSLPIGNSARTFSTYYYTADYGTTKVLACYGEDSALKKKILITYSNGYIRIHDGATERNRYVWNSYGTANPFARLDWTYDGAGALKLYINGSLQQTWTGLSLATTTTNPLTIGKQYGVTATGISGQICMYSIDNVERSATWLLETYKSDINSLTLTWGLERVSFDSFMYYDPSTSSFEWWNMGYKNWKTDLTATTFYLPVTSAGITNTGAITTTSLTSTNITLTSSPASRLIYTTTGGALANASSFSLDGTTLTGGYINGVNLRSSGRCSQYGIVYTAGDLWFSGGADMYYDGTNVRFLAESTLQKFQVMGGQNVGDPSGMYIGTSYYSPFYSQLDPCSLSSSFTYFAYPIEPNVYSTNISSSSNGGWNSTWNINNYGSRTHTYRLYFYRDYCNVRLYSTYYAETSVTVYDYWGNYDYYNYLSWNMPCNCGALIRCTATNNGGGIWEDWSAYVDVGGSTSWSDYYSSSWSFGATTSTPVYTQNIQRTYRYYDYTSTGCGRLYATDVNNGNPTSLVYSEYTTPFPIVTLANDLSSASATPNYAGSSIEASGYTFTYRIRPYWDNGVGGRLYSANYSEVSFTDNGLSYQPSDPSGASMTIQYGGTGAWLADGYTQGYYIYAYKDINGTRYYSTNYTSVSQTDDDSNGTGVGDPTTNASAESTSAGAYNIGDSIDYAIYAYKTIHGQTVYSATPLTFNITIANNNSVGCDLAWTDPADAEGIRILKTFNATTYAMDVNATGTTNSAFDDGSGWAGGQTVTPTTATIYYNVDVSWTGNGQYDGFRVLKSDDSKGTPYVYDYSWDISTNTYFTDDDTGWANDSTVTPSATQITYQIDLAWNDLTSVASGVRIIRQDNHPSYNYNFNYLVDLDVATYSTGWTDNFSSWGYFDYDPYVNEYVGYYVNLAYGGMQPYPTRIVKSDAELGYNYDHFYEGCVNFTDTPPTFADGGITQTLYWDDGVSGGSIYYKAWSKRTVNGFTIRSTNYTDGTYYLGTCGATYFYLSPSVSNGSYADSTEWEKNGNEYYLGSSSFADGDGTMSWISGSAPVYESVVPPVLFCDGDNFRSGVAINPPASSTSAGKKGTFTFDNDYFYGCVADNTWKRGALYSW